LKEAEALVPGNPLVTRSWMEKTLVRLPFRDFVPIWRGRIVSDAAPLDCSQLASLRAEKISRNQK
jgi:hypothetical protein